MQVHYTYDGTLSCASRFTGKERDTETGLDYFGARYYGSNMGRFIQSDLPFADWDFEDPQSLNLYGYVRNNPLRMVDPDGQGAWDLAKGAAVGAWNFARNTVFSTGQLAVAVAQDAGSPVPMNTGTMLGTPVVNAVEDYSTKGLSGVANDVLAQGEQGAMEIVTEAVLTGGLAASSRVNSVLPETGTVTRYMGPGEAATAAKNGAVPNTDAAMNPRPTHVTTDRPLDSGSAAKAKYELGSTPSHRATVPTSRAGKLGPAPDGRPTTSGGGSQAATNKPIPVKPNEIKKLKD